MGKEERCVRGVTRQGSKWKRRSGEMCKERNRMEVEEVERKSKNRKRKRKKSGSQNCNDTRGSAIPMRKGGESEGGGKRITNLCSPWLLLYFRVQVFVTALIKSKQRHKGVQGRRQGRGRVKEKGQERREEDKRGVSAWLFIVIGE